MRSQMQKCSLCRSTRLFELGVLGAKLEMVSRRQLSILQASALDSPVIKAGPFYWLKRKKKRKSPAPFQLFPLHSSICKSGTNTSLSPVRAIRAEQVCPLAAGWLRPCSVTSAHQLGESICACRSGEGGHQLNWVTCSEDGFIFHRRPRRCLMELLSAHHTSCPPRVCLSLERRRALRGWGSFGWFGGAQVARMAQQLETNTASVRLAS